MSLLGKQGFVFIIVMGHHVYNFFYKINVTLKKKVSACENKQTDKTCSALLLYTEVHTFSPGVIPASSWPVELLLTYRYVVIEIIFGFEALVVKKT